MRCDVQYMVAEWAAQWGYACHLTTLFPAGTHSYSYDERNPLPGDPRRNSRVVFNVEIESDAPGPNPISMLAAISYGGFAWDQNDIPTDNATVTGDNLAVTPESAWHPLPGKVLVYNGDKTFRLEDA